MSLSGPSSYVPTLNGFQSHWDAVETEINPSGPFTITDPANPSGPRLANVVIDDFTTELQGYALSIADDVARGDVADAVLTEAKRSALNAAQEFGRKVREDGLLRHLAPRLPELPKVHEGEGPFMHAMTTVRSRWTQADAILTGSLVLASGETQAQFATRITTLGTQFNAADDADVDAGILRSRRDEVQDSVREVLASYRAAVEGRFPPEHPLVISLPRIYPLAGHTPEAVAAAGTWQAATSQARLTWTASADADLDHYEIRTSNAGSTYDVETETILGQVAKDAAALEFLTAAGLATPGASARFRIYVILTTGNERGSETVTVTRP